MEQCKIISKYTILHVSTKLEQEKGKKAKSEIDVDPPQGMGSGLERAYSKNIFLHYDWLQYHQYEISETSWSVYRLKPRSYNSAKFLNFSGRGDPWGDLNAPEATFKHKLILFSVTPDKKHKSCLNNIFPKSL